MKILSTLLICTIIAYSSLAQGPRLHDKNSIGWFTAVVTPTISKKVSLHGEYQWRRANFLKHWQQGLIRTGITYKANSQVSFQVGFALAHTFPYGKYNLASVARDFPEHRIYEQVALNSAIGKTTLINRVRLEQRWIGRYSSLTAEKPNYVYVNRVRYMPRIDYPFSQRWYGSAYDEIFIGFGKNVVENVFDQNRIGLLVGFKPSSRYKFELGFINQVVQLGREIDNKNVFQSNNGLLVNTYFNF